MVSNKAFLAEIHASKGEANIYAVTIATLAQQSHVAMLAKLVIRNFV